MVYIKLFDTESNEFRLLDPSIGFEQMITFVQEHFDNSDPIFRFTDDEGDVVTFSTQQELLFLKELAESHGWNKIKINLERKKKPSESKNESKHERMEPDEKQPEEFLKFIEENAPAFFSALGIDCTAYREETTSSKSNKGENNSLESKTVQEEPVPTLNIDLKMPTTSQESTAPISFDQKAQALEEMFNKFDTQGNKKFDSNKNNEVVKEKTKHSNPFAASTETDLNPFKIERVEKSIEQFPEIKPIEQKPVFSSVERRPVFSSIQQKPGFPSVQQTVQRPPCPFQFSPAQHFQPQNPSFCNPLIFPFERELAELQSMGFTDIEKMKRCLIECGGELIDTVNMLLN